MLHWWVAPFKSVSKLHSQMRQTRRSTRQQTSFPSNTKPRHATKTEFSINTDEISDISEQTNRILNNIEPDEDEDDEETNSSVNSQQMLLI